MLTVEQIQGFLIGHQNGSFIKKNNFFYDEAVKEKSFINETFQKTSPSWFTEKRPKEKEIHKKYRADSYERIGNNVIGVKSRIERGIKSIRSISDYSIKFNNTENEVAKDFKNYVKEVYPIYGDYEGWFWDTIIDKLVTDDNGVMYCLPQIDEEDKFQQPIVKFAKTENVLCYKQSSLCVILSEDKSDIIGINNEELLGVGSILIFITKTGFTIAKQTREIKAKAYDKDGSIFSEYEITGVKEVDGEIIFKETPHYCKSIPALKVGYYIESSALEGQILCKSIIHDSIPDLRRAIELSFDKYIEETFHATTEEWRISSKSCTSCNGTGVVKEKLRGGGVSEKKCTAVGCFEGHYMPVTGTLENGLLPNPLLNENSISGGSVSTQVPVFGGFIERNLESAKLFKQHFEDHLKLAYMASSLEYIFRDNAVQSGEFKKLDKEDAENFFITLSQHIVGKLLNNSLEWIYQQRYIKEGKKLEYFPYVVVPTRFSLETSTELFERLNLSIKAGIDPLIINEIEEEYLYKEYGANSDIYKKARLSNLIDPLSGKSDLGKALGKPTLQWWENILSEQVTHLINMAILEDEDFLMLDLKIQVERVQQMAKEKEAPTLENQDRAYVIKEQVSTRNIN